jgi:uncharacterized protein YecE (DUF72 family)
VAERFPGPGSYLERYARVFACVEINSTFKQTHRASTYARWAAATPAGFRFSAKLPHEITHLRRLEKVVAPLDRFLGEVTELGDRLGPLLVQFPGSLAFAPRVANTFFGVLRRRFAGAVVCEPRHAGWFGEAAERLFARYRISRAAADPARVPGAELPGGWLGDAGTRGVAYFRWHGSPDIYWSSYSAAQIERLASDLGRWSEHADGWCIFDNTASGAATPNALEMMGRVAAPV